MITLNVNGRSHDIADEANTPLLYVLRDTLALNGAKFGCGLGQCGSCTVVVDGKPIFSCLTPISILQGRKITTLEGLGTEDAPSPLQRAFMEEQAAQCGYCIPGMVMRAHALLTANGAPSDAQIREHMNPNLCRCGTHMRILAAIKRAARDMQAADASAPRQEVRP
jgi:nicotinate dehydrogenase subunit A